MNHKAAQWIPLFPEEEVPFILSAVLRCSAELRKRHATEHENRLSDRLRKLLVQDAEFRLRPVELDRECYLFDDKTTSEAATGRLDFRFSYSTGSQKPWPYFGIEAKRLHVLFPSGWESLVPEYVTGNQGMMCFIEQRYAQRLASGGMLGYVFDGDVENARVSVAASIAANHQRLKCAAPYSLAPSGVLADDSRVAESVHTLANRDFTVYHLFVAV
jgi:hypothetical protein